MDLALALRVVSRMGGFGLDLSSFTQKWLDLIARALVPYGFLFLASEQWCFHGKSMHFFINLKFSLCGSDGFEVDFWRGMEICFLGCTVVSPNIYCC